MKKFFSVLLCLAIWLSASAYDFEVDGIYYDTIGNGQVKVTYMDGYNTYTGNVTIPSTVTYDSVVYYVTTIGKRAFYICDSLTSVTIGSNVFSIEDYAFAGCVNITAITCHATIPPNVKSNTFAKYSVTLYVPLGSINAYSSATYWRYFNIRPIPGISHTITVDSNDEQMGTTIGSGTYIENSTAQLIAVTQAGYSFRQWNDGNTDNPRDVVVTGDSAFSAEFAVANDTIYLEYDGSSAMQYSLEDQGVYYFGGKVYNSQNLHIKLFYSDGKLLSSGTNDMDMSYYAEGIYIVTDGKGGFLKINHSR